jgi:hypothetical protein
VVGTIGEAQLISVARGLFGGTRPAELHALLFESYNAPAQLSRGALRVLEDTLAKGAVTWLVKNGAWRERLWEQQEPLPLKFDRQAMRVLQWLLDTALVREAPTPLRLDVAGSIGCELLLLAALNQVAGTAAEGAVASQDAVRASALCRVAMPVSLVLAGGVPLSPPLAFTAEQDFVLAALQPALARGWHGAVKLVARLLLPADVERCGRAQAAVLEQLFNWAEAAGRRERCAFLLEALAPMLHERATVADFVAGFDVKLPLKDRHSARRAAGATLFALERLEKWDEEDRLVRFVDDGYEAAQARVKALDATFGRGRFLIARRLRDELVAMDT